ncbi:Putative Krueppel protein [Rhizopus microsporus]|nr:Putative Krueppel protein [Rhizopus microsporus]
MSNEQQQHHHHSRLFYFLTDPSKLSSLINPSQSGNVHQHPLPLPSLPTTTTPIAVAAVQDCCNQCCRTIPIEQQQQQQSISTEPIQCKWSSCLQSFTQPEDLAPHLFKDHVNKNRKKQLKCYWESCSETVEDLLKHLTSQHLMGLWLACRWINCNKRFEGFNTLTNHVSEDHVGSGKNHAAHPDTHGSQTLSVPSLPETIFRVKCDDAAYAHSYRRKAISMSRLQ